ncbi:lactate utilization protein [Roseomonas sp. CECT 9278]|uniref:LutC/YkgG family protein n=1 Tax=Roseomonas sp. CECT 9278 TaxID=2845823 RepID=UPI001E2FF9A5|nr:lactate utilization protein [Roseomonas sp. CECT 9278]CAH0253413.1 Lactate utilization protein C [Roseomonas sp. CECT 9278]
MSKDAILGAIRRGLKRGPLPADQRAMLDGRLATHPRHLIPARSRVPRPEQIALFIRNVEKEFGTVARVADAAEIPGAIADYLAAQNLAPRFVLAPHPELAALPWADKPLLEFEARRAEATDAVSVQHGYAAIAETGTLMLPSDATRPTTLNLLAETEVVVLRTSRIMGAYEEAWDTLRREGTDATTGGIGTPSTTRNVADGRPFMPRNVMLVTGPSRSADIEQTLELGAHGPRRLHIVLLDDDAADPPAQAPAAAPAQAAPAAATKAPTPKRGKARTGSTAPPEA